MEHMSSTEIKNTEETSDPQVVVSWKQTFPWWYILGMSAVVLLSILLNFYRLGQDGYDNLYYAAGIESMLMNWHNFFFVSFDPAGFVSIDKPPVSFWLQVGSARLFGLSPWSVLLPQALAGVLSVPLLAYLVRRTFGPLAGLLAAVALAVTPISVVTNRNMTMDSLLTFVLLLAAWALLRAVETGRLRLLVLSFLLVGIGFNIKMLDAYLILPAFILLYWFSAPYAKKIRLWHLALATGVLLLVSLCWITAVDLTPATQRPFVGSSGSSNSELQLALLYNGGTRILGDLDNVSLLPTAEALKLQKQLPNFAQSSFFLGDPGLQRLVTQPLGAQIGWLIPLAVLGLIGVRWDKPSFWPLNRQQQGLALWGIWFVTQFVVFSSAVFFHPHYLVQMAPSVSALVAMGVVTTWKATARRRWLFPLLLLATALVQVVLLSAYIKDWEGWLLLIVVLGAVAGLLLAKPFRRGRSVLLALALCAMLVGPTVWSIIPLLDHRDDTFPYAGPTVDVSPLEGDVLQMNQNLLPDNALISYLQQHQGTDRYLAATVSSYQSAPMILATAQPVMTLGGYQGQDQILSQAQLQHLIANGTVRYFVFPQSLQEAHLSPALTKYQHSIMAGYESAGATNINSLTDWVSGHCAQVPQSQWHTAQAITYLNVFDCG
jgi:4-amino-4-deoxy-L-arabinose transferase-like glycosyltransferase